MYEVFNWGYTNDEPPKRFSLSIVGSEINIDGPTTTTTCSANKNINNTKNTSNTENNNNQHHNHHYKQYSNHNFYSTKGEDAV